MKKIVIGIVGAMAGIATGVALSKTVFRKGVNEKVEKIEKFKGYYGLLNQWLYLKQTGSSLTDYFLKNDYNKIAIYGLGDLGSRLIDELKNSNIEILYGIDKNTDDISSELEIYSLEQIDDIEEMVDVVVVTAVFAFDEIEEELCDKFDCDIVSLEDVVFG